MADEQLEQLFIDIVKVWSTLLGSPAFASTAAAPEALSCHMPPSAPLSTVEAALGAHHRLMRSVVTQPPTGTRARSSRRNVASIGVAR